MCFIILTEFFTLTPLYPILMIFFNNQYCGLICIQDIKWQVQKQFKIF